jgi:tRNA(adenine34) deaminase
MNQHDTFMKEAIAQAKLADAKNEVPVGAVVVLDGKVIGRGFNQPISSNDPTAHAEVLALRDAASSIQNYRLVNADLYVTIEPCTMCAGAIVHGRVRRVIYGASEPKAGVVHSQQNIFQEPYFNHSVEVLSGVLAQECSDVMQAFFNADVKKKRHLN